MTDVIKTSEVSAPPSIALAMMIWRRVWREVHGGVPTIMPFRRVDTTYSYLTLSASSRYYRALDCISSGGAL